MSIHHIGLSFSDAAGKLASKQNTHAHVTSPRETALSMAAVFYLTMHRWFHLVATLRILRVNHSQPWLLGSIQHIKQLTFCLCTEYLWEFMEIWKVHDVILQLRREGFDVCCQVLECSPAEGSREGLAPTDTQKRCLDPDKQSMLASHLLISVSLINHKLIILIYLSHDL